MAEERSAKIAGGQDTGATSLGKARATAMPKKIDTVEEEDEDDLEEGEDTQQELCLE